MKKSALFILFALISVAGFSQITGWNAKVGMNISNYTGDADLNAKIGFKLGGGFEYAFDNTWSLQPSLFLSTKGAKKDGNSINAMYLELPVMAAARFNVADNTNIVVNAGPYLACGIAGKTKIDLGNDTERKYDTFGDDALKRFDAGLGVGVALELGKVIVGLDGQFGLVDVIRRRYVALTPEEWVRQHFVHFLMTHKGYPQALMANEVQVQLNGTKKRCDTVLYRRDLTARMIVEYKAPEVEITQKVFDQITRYNMVLKVDYLIVSNGIRHYCCRMDYEQNSYTFLQDIPDYASL